MAKWHEASLTPGPCRTINIGLTQPELTVLCLRETCVTDSESSAGVYDRGLTLLAPIPHSENQMCRRFGRVGVKLRSWRILSGLLLKKFAHEV